ncbi:hypothetical protein CGC20_29160 [Leishmania donovani]|uniref:Uncharacterized protein n=2 Tax=Leishmania donovani TaxID=5661 RepID=A0A504X859_LEIDO|nr:hypothetical protein CGC20_29160 [Leishmania donovani]TPP48265.1 hypothetical protein CGC21_13075 [Leishmania donovani]
MRRFLRSLNLRFHVALRQSHSTHTVRCVRASTNTRVGDQTPALAPELAAAASSDKPLCAASTDSTSSSGDTANKQTSRHPMELLTRVFQRHPPALRLHRELTIALADGDSARAADLASVLATTVQRVVAAEEADSSDAATPPEGPASTEHFSQSDIPVAGLEDVEEAVEKTRQALLHEATVQVSSGVARDTGGGAVSSAPAAAERSLPFWRDPERLCVTVLESTFETEVLGGESQDTLTPAGNRAAEHEAEQVRILDAYLDKEDARWKAQKAAIAKIVLDVTRSLGLTPEDLQAFEGISASAGAGAAAAVGERKLNVLRHSNLVIRGEMPSAPLSNAASERVSEGVEAELRALEERMSSLGQPLTPSEVRMARYELQMSKSKMRYVVGVHKELQLALDHSAALRASLREKSTAEVTFSTGAEVFMAEVIRALNEGADAYSANVTAAGAQLTVSNVKAREAVESPVLPFTFMLKCSLWFTTAPPRPPSSSSD